jgi:small subunit ribosomal protein S6
MRLSEDVIRYMTVKQDGPLPAPRPSSKNESKSEKKDSPDAEVDSKEKQPIASGDISTSGKDDAETKENAES